MNTIVIFDVNETLLDLHPVRAWFDERFGGKPDARTWFTELLRLSFVSSVTDRYAPFTDLAGSALETVAYKSGTGLDGGDLTTIKGILATLPAHRDVAVGLERLSKANFRLAALTNSPLATARTQLDNAGIAHLFDTIMSVEMVKRFKPHRSVYLAAARELSAEPSGLVMVAAHDWDVAGAIAAGLEGVFVQRPGQIYSPAFVPPTMVVSNVSDAATAIIERYTRT